MNFGDVSRALRTNTKEHLPAILAGGAVLGTLATAYLTGKATVKAYDVIRKHEETWKPSDNRKERVMERTKLVWKFYIPPAIAATSTIGFIIGAHRVELRKLLAAQTALAVSERVYSEYREKVVEELGDRTEQSIRDQIVDERVKKEAPSEGVIVVAPGHVLCCELFTGRYFPCDMETLRKSVNEINRKILTHDYATFDDFYDLIGLKPTSTSNQLGWKASKLMDVIFTTCMTDDGRPCLAFDYNYVETL